jgi:hypothetical protein
VIDFGSGARLNDVHVIPHDDLIRHEYCDCPCGPDQELIPTDHGGDAYLVTHHSLDGREVYE